jgi:hypothetical protein
LEDASFSLSLTVGVSKVNADGVEEKEDKVDAETESFDDKDDGFAESFSIWLRGKVEGMSTVLGENVVFCLLVTVNDRDNDEEDPGICEEEGGFFSDLKDVFRRSFVFSFCFLSPIVGFRNPGAHERPP